MSDTLRRSERAGRASKLQAIINAERQASRKRSNEAAFAAGDCDADLGPEDLNSNPGVDNDSEDDGEVFELDSAGSDCEDDADRQDSDAEHQTAAGDGAAGDGDSSEDFDENEQGTTYAAEYPRVCCMLWQRSVSTFETSPPLHAKLGTCSTTMVACSAASRQLHRMIRCSWEGVLARMLSTVLVLLQGLGCF
jgi:hypothetical protein